jgi:DUF4097 and DUF4098 domain-containing protein YvlB
MSTLATLRNHGHWKAAGLLVPGLLLCSVSFASADRIERHFKVEAHPVVTIHNPNGIVTVRAWTKSDVMVVAKRATTEVEVDAEQNGNRVDILTRQVADTASPDDLRTDLEISVPQDAELQIHNDAGGVNVSNVLGDMNVETIAAGVDLEDTAGYMTVKTVGGAFQCVRCAGRLEVTSISGSFKLIDLKSVYVRAQTSEGNILFNGSFMPMATYVLKNYSGQIEVRFSPGDSFDLSATSLKGKVHNEANLTPSSHHHFLPKFGNALFGTFNSGRARVELNSFDGTINILKRD